MATLRLESRCIGDIYVGVQVGDLYVFVLVQVVGVVGVSVGVPF